MAFNNIKNIANTVTTGVDKGRSIVASATKLVGSVKSLFSGGIFDKIGGVFTGSLSLSSDPSILSDSFTTEKAGPHNEEVQRDWLYAVSIINPKFTDSEIFNTTSSSNELIMRAKNFTMPQKTVTTVETSFYGHKQVVPVDVDYERSFSISFEESQNQFILRNFNSWINIFDVFSDVVAQEASNYAQGTVSDLKSVFASNIEMYMYRYNGEHEGVRVTFFNCFPTSLGNSTWGYDSTSKISYDINFSYDYFKIEKNNLASYSGTTLAGGFGEVGEMDFSSLGKFGGVLAKAMKAIKKAQEVKEKAEAAVEMVRQKVSQARDVVSNTQDLLGEVGIESKSLSKANNFLGSTEESIKHGAGVMAKFGPILAKSGDTITLIGTTGEEGVRTATTVNNSPLVTKLRRNSSK